MNFEWILKCILPFPSITLPLKCWWEFLTFICTFLLAEWQEAWLCLDPDSTCLLSHSLLVTLEDSCQPFPVWWSVILFNMKYYMNILSLILGHILNVHIYLISCLMELFLSRFPISWISVCWCEMVFMWCWGCSHGKSWTACWLLYL